jgi:hypothetical protein
MKYSSSVFIILLSPIVSSAHDAAYLIAGAMLGVLTAAGFHLYTW